MDLSTENWTPLLMRWYDENKRELPWRTESPRDPYKVWVSEIMLQQTRVEAVKSYYMNWMEHFPDISSLAVAGEDEVMRQWQGLGYYSRARNLHMAAREVMETCGGRVPETREEIRKLKGVGDYTAGAVLSMAYGKRETAVDGNVLRVFARVYKIEENILSSVVKKEITVLVEARQDPLRPGDFNEALMDLGATVCIPGQPRCEVCPLKAVCMAKAAGLECEIPLRVTKKEVPVETVTVFVVKIKEEAAGQEMEKGRAVEKNNGKPVSGKGGQKCEGNGTCLFLLHRRPSTGLLAGMWEFPNYTGEDKQVREALNADLQKTGTLVKEIAGPLRRIKHVFSHKIWQMTVYETEAVPMNSLLTAGKEKHAVKKKSRQGTVHDISGNMKASLPTGWRWVPAGEVESYNLAGPHNKIWKALSE